MLTESKFIYVSQDELAMLNHVVGIHVFHGVIGSVDVRVSVLKSRFEDERRGEATPHRRAMIGTRVSTCAVDICDVGVLYRS